MEGQQTGVQGLGQVHVRVADRARAIVFYRDVLGLRFLFEAGDMAFLDCGGVRIMLSEAETEEQDHAASILYYRVSDIASEHTRMESLGVEFVEAPRVIAVMGSTTLWMAFFRDGEGNLAALMSEVPT